MEGKLLSFFEELELLLNKVNKAFPEGAPGQERRNSITMSDNDNVFIVVHARNKRNQLVPFFVELDEHEDKAQSFEDIIQELSKYIEAQR